MRLRPKPLPPEQFIAGNTVHLWSNASRALDAMFEAIEAATHQVLVEMYWFDADRVGTRFRDALLAARQRGVEVTVLYDAIGSWGTRRSHFAPLIESGARVLEFGAIGKLIGQLHLQRLTRRNHRKLLITDQRHAFVGGVNWAEPWLTREQGGEGWKDDVLQVSGPVVSQLQLCFERSQAEAVPPPELPPPPAARLLPSEPTGETQGAKLPASYQSETLASSPPTARGIGVAILAHGRYRERRQILRTYRQRIDSAQSHAYLSNAYFVPPGGVVRCLVRAARRGVDVRILLPARSDVAIVPYASRALYEYLLRRGVRIFEYLPAVLHSKLAVVDARWLTVGSFNLDSLSIHRNRELNLSLLDSTIAGQARDDFLHCLQDSREVSLDHFLARPRTVRLLERAAYSLRHWL